MSSSKVSVRLNPSFDEWYGARAVVEEQLKVIGKALESIRISSQLQDAFTGHLFAVHHQWCEACPPAREPGLPAGGLEKEAPTNIPTRAAAAHNAMKQKTAVSCVSTFTQTTDINGHRLQMNAQGGDDDNNDGISKTSVPLSMTCRVEDEESQADVNRTLEKPSTEKVVSTEFIKLEVLEDVQSPDVLLRLNKGHCDVDMDSSKEETPSQQIHEEELPSQHIESGDQSHLERTNTVSHQLIKQEEDSQGHCDVDMAGSSSETMSYQGPVEEIPLDTPDQQLCLEGVNKVSDQPIKHEKDSEGHCDLDMAGSSSEAVSHQEPVEEIPLDRSGGQLQLEGMNKDSGQPIKHEKDSQGHCDFDMAGSSSEAMSHQGPMDEIPLDRSDGTNNTVSAVSCDVPSQEGVFKDPCLDSHKKVQETSRTDDGTNHASSTLNSDALLGSEGVSADQCLADRTNNSAQDCEVPGPSGVTADQCPAGLDSNKKVQKTSGSDDGTNHASSTLNCDVLAEEISTDQCLAGLDSYKKVQKNSGSDFKMKLQCSDCSKRYSCMRNYQKHLSSHSCQKPYQCSVCSKTFTRKESFDTHMLKHKVDKPFKCDQCSYQCYTKQTLTDHTKMHTGAYKCSYCDKIFCRKGHLKRHMRVHTGEKPHACSLCGKRFVYSNTLKRHMIVHTGQKPHQCSFCDGTKNASSSLNCDVLTEEVSADQCLADLDSYKKVEKNSGSDCKMKFQYSDCSKRYSYTHENQKHFSTHTCQKPYHCSVCSKSFTRKVSFVRHLMKHQGEKKLFKCDHCSYQCNTKQTLTDHTKMHTGAYKCSSCGKIFDHKGDMERQVEKPFKCDHCSSKSASKSNCQVHRRRIEKPYKCDYCTHTCATKQRLKTHLTVHAGEKPHQCSLCGKRFQKPSHLKIHLRAHSGEKPYSCDICDYRCSDKGRLTKHMRVHTGEKPHQCSLCGKRFLQSSYLKIHMRTHSGEKPYSCDICDYRCSDKGRLTRHMRVHTGEKPYHCSLCGKRFIQSSSLKHHLRTHSGEKPYSCDICDYRCSTKGNLTRHMGVHTGKKPHQCSLCGKSFLQSSYLKIHMRNHTGEKPYSCDICDYRCSTKGQLTRHMRVHTG